MDVCIPVACHLLLDFNKSPLLPTSIHRLNALLPVMAADLLSAEVIGHLRTLFDYISILGRLERREVPSNAPSAPYLVWWGCEARRGEGNRTAESLTPCVASAAGELEMCAQVRHRLGATQLPCYTG